MLRVSPGYMGIPDWIPDEVLTTRAGWIAQSLNKGSQQREVALLRGFRRSNRQGEKSGGAVGRDDGITDEGVDRGELVEKAT